MPKVSIIVPVYNVEKYIEKCIYSAMTQTLQDIEIICIDDGSTDSCYTILKQLQRQDPRIQVIHKDNTGYGHTMNTGLDIAKGKYIVFLESDDFILPDMCQTLYDVCEKNDLDIAKAGYYRFFTAGDNIYKRFIPASWNDNYRCVLGDTRRDEMFQSERYTWMCMYSRDYLNTFCIRHNETPGASFQDNGFWFLATMYCRRMFFLDEGFYMYRLDNPTSSIHNGTKIHALADEYAFVRERIKTYLGDQKWLFTQAALYDFGLHFWYFTCVDKILMRQLADILSHEVRACFASELFQIKLMDQLYLRKLLTCLANPDLFCKKMQEEIDDIDKRYNLVNCRPYIILYGAGAYAEYTMDVLNDFVLWDKTVLCGVTSLKDNQEYFRGIKIQEMKELVSYKDVATVLLCVRKDSKYFYEMNEKLRQWGFPNVVYAQDFNYKKDVWDY